MLLTCLKYIKERMDGCIDVASWQDPQIQLQNVANND